MFVLLVWPPAVTGAFRNGHRADRLLPFSPLHGQKQNESLVDAKAPDVSPA